MSYLCDKDKLLPYQNTPLSMFVDLNNIKLIKTLPHIRKTENMNF